MIRTMFAQPADSMIGHKVNGAEVIADAGTRYSSKQKFWRLRCACGNEFEKPGTDIRRRPETIRCRECFKRANGDLNRTHGESKTVEHKLWVSIKRRCFDKKWEKFYLWGGRGITMHPDWIDNYPAFAAYIRENLGPRPSPRHSVDRIDNDGHYEPGNLRWATAEEQSANRRCSKRPPPQ